MNMGSKSERRENNQHDLGSRLINLLIFQPIWRSDVSNNGKNFGLFATGAQLNRGCCGHTISR